jgi:hypothetical protein
MDCTHVTWLKCPKELINSCKGREKHATVKFQVVCDHTRKILYCSGWYPGAMHDIAVCRNDQFSKKCMEERLKMVEYILFDQYGRPRKCKGGHVLVDGGYLKYACFICPQLQRCESSAVYWSELLESVSKDIECVFGILKARFRILKMQLEVKYASTIEAIFQCCCILHNILLVHDGLDTKYNDEAFWSHLSPENDNEEESTDIENIIEEHQSTQHCLYVPEEMSHGLNGTSFEASEQLFEKKCDYLIRHNHKQYQMGLLLWPKSIPSLVKQAMNYRQRASEFIFNSLYMKKSLYIGKNNAESMGYGLFSNVTIEVGVIIGKYHGEFITTSERLNRTAQGKGGYFIHFNANECLDCFKERNLKKCKLSFCNSATNAISSRTSEDAIQNVKLVVNPRSRTASLKVIRRIQAHEEIFTDYNSDYTYGPVQDIHLTGDSIDLLIT